VQFAEELEPLHPLDGLERMPPRSIGFFHFFQIGKSRHDRLDHPRPGCVFITMTGFHGGQTIPWACHRTNLQQPLMPKQVLYDSRLPVGLIMGHFCVAGSPNFLHEQAERLKRVRKLRLDQPGTAQTHFVEPP